MKYQTGIGWIVGMLVGICGCSNDPGGVEPMSVSNGIFEAVEHGDIGEVTSILDRDPSQVHARYSPELPDMPIHSAAGSGHLQLVELLIERGADIHAQGEFGLSPLHFAVQNAHGQIAELLVQRGADVEARAEGGHTPLLWAAVKGTRERAGIDVIVRRGANLDAHNEEGLNALELAGYGGSTAVIDVLLDHGFELDLRSAMVKVRPEVVRAILRHDALAVKKTRPHCGGLLGDAVLMVDQLVYQETLPLRGNDRLTTSRGIVRQYVDVFEAMYAQGISNEASYCALFCALHLPDPAIAEVLLKHGAHREGGGLTSADLFVAASVNQVCSMEMIDLLGEYGVKRPPHSVEPAPPAVLALIENLKDRDRIKRFMAASSLGLYGDRAKSAVPALLQACKDADPSVRSAAAAAVKLIDPDAAAEAGIH